MFEVYIAQLCGFLLISLITTFFIFRFCKSNNEEAKENKKINEWIYLVPIFIALVGGIAVVFQYIFEKPQVPKVIEVNINSSILDSEYKIVYHNKNITSRVAELVNMDTSTLGEYIVNVNIPYSNKVLQKDLLVIVKDKEAPVITLDFADMEKVSYTKDLTKEGYHVTDNLDKNVAEKVGVECIKIEDNIKTYRYTVSDESSNIATCEISLEIVDDVKPEITLIGDKDIVINLNENYEEQGATAKDEIDLDLTDRISIISNVDTSTVGEYIVQYIVSDNSGNKAEITRNVTVIDPNAGIGTIFLTFDDGPSYLTPQILDILKARNVKATFFVIDYYPEYEYIIRRIVDEGHTIAIHGTSHVYSQIYSSVDAFMYNITSLREKIKNTTGKDTTILRFPGGSSNTVSRRYHSGIMTALTQRLTQEGYKYFDWNVDSNDAGGASSPNEIYYNVTSALIKERANVVLMHDAGGKVHTLNALNDIITYGQNNGYKFSNITNNTYCVHHNVNN